MWPNWARVVTSAVAAAGVLVVAALATTPSRPLWVFAEGELSEPVSASSEYWLAEAGRCVRVTMESTLAGRWTDALTSSGLGLLPWRRHWLTQPQVVEPSIRVETLDACGPDGEPAAVPGVSIAQWYSVPTCSDGEWKLKLDSSGVHSGCHPAQFGPWPTDFSDVRGKSYQSFNSATVATTDEVSTSGPDPRRVRLCLTPTAKVAVGTADSGDLTQVVELPPQCLAYPA